MSKEYSGINDELYFVYKTGKKCFSMAPKLELPDDKKYGAVLDLDKSKVVFRINDYSKGTGSNSQKASFNLNVRDMAVLGNLIRRGCSVTERSYSKLHSFQTDQNGLSNMYNMSISRNPKMKTKDKSGNWIEVDAKIPWLITISSGKARPVKMDTGACVAQQGTYVEDVKVSVRLTDDDMVRFWDSFEDFKNLFITSASALKRFERATQLKLDSDGNRKASYNEPEQPEQTYSDYQGYEDYGEYYEAQEEPPAPPQPQQSNPAPVKNQSAPAPSTLPDKATAFDVKIIDTEWTTLEDNSVVASCIVNGKERVVYFDRITSAMEDAKSNKNNIKLYLYPSERNGEKIVRCFGEAR